MRPLKPLRSPLWALLLVGAGALACAPLWEQDAQPADAKSGADLRATRRAYDGAPPTIPHPNFGASCVECHTDRGVEVPEVGFSPPSPHSAEQVAGGLARCVQCHVWREGEGHFSESAFVGLAQDLRRGPRQHPLAPPRMPHQQLMRENCSACHDGPAAREEIRVPHPERTRCVQCHLPIETTAVFPPELSEG